MCSKFVVDNFSETYVAICPSHFYSEVQNLVILVKFSSIQSSILKLVKR